MTTQEEFKNLTIPCMIYLNKQIEMECNKKAKTGKI